MQENDFKLMLAFEQGPRRHQLGQTKNNIIIWFRPAFQGSGPGQRQDHRDS